MKIIFYFFFEIFFNEIFILYFFGLKILTFFLKILIFFLKKNDFF